MKRDINQNDAIWVRSYQKGSDKAFNKLYDRYERPLFSYLLKMLNNKQIAEDVFQQTWMKVIKALPEYREQQRFGSWLFGIAHHAAIDQIRKTGKQLVDEFASETLDEIDAGAETPDTILIKDEDSARLYEAVEQLPVAQRSVILMRLHGEISFKEIADIEKCSINTVLGRMHYAIANLKKVLVTDTQKRSSYVL
ncbi:sigma-70 family RNA polymerase sigma factor [bacterium]|nr:sigma-70 family RNA polymerase sigma factor [bacterium]